MNKERAAQLTDLFDLFDNQTPAIRMKILAIVTAAKNNYAEEERMMQEYLNGKKDALQPIFNKYIPELERRLNMAGCCPLSGKGAAHGGKDQL